MATFQNRVEALTQFPFGANTDPSVAELTEFLKDGVHDVTNKTLEIDPREAEKFQRESSIVDSNGGFEVKGAKILSVMREGTADGSSDGSTAWYPCRKIPASLQSRVVDPDSLEYASIYNPVYTIIDYNKVHVYPVPDGTNDGFKVFYINNVPTDQTNGVSLVYSHSDIKYFPDEKVSLVVLYASIKTLEALAGSKAIAQDTELVNSYASLANSLKAEYNAAFQSQQPQQQRQER